MDNENQCKGKVTFKTANSAKNALYRTRGYGMKRWYQCDECHYYHLTETPSFGSNKKSTQRKRKNDHDYSTHN